MTSPPHSTGTPIATSWRWLIVLVAGCVVWLLHPSDVEPEAWRLLSIFVATIVGLIARPVPPGAIAMVSIVVVVLTRTVMLGEALAGFSNSTVWLVLGAFFIAAGFLKTGLGARIAYLFLAALGRRTLGLAYGLIATDLVLAPAIPSNTARAGGVVFPILRALGVQLEAQVGAGRRTRAFLTLTVYNGTVVTGSMFLTSMAANPLAAELAGGMGISISWTRWAVAAVVPGLCSLVAVPLLIYVLCPPDVRQTEGARELARRELERLGPASGPEWIMVGVFVGVLSLWIFGPMIGVDATTAALAGLAVLLVTGVLEWNDIAGNREAWSTAVWFATLVTMAALLNERGLTSWFSTGVADRLGSLSWLPAFLLLSGIYFYSHYFFASNTAHVGAMYAPFLAVALAVGTPPLLAALLLAYFSNLMACLTHYGTAPAPILFGAGDVSLGSWWGVGAVFSLVHITIWIGIGGLWWRLLGLW